jgi:hypothetical protein
MRTPEILFYFNEKPYSPKTQDEAVQWSKVLQFRESFPKEGLWWLYNGKPHFEKLVRVHLSKLVRSRCQDPGLHNLLHPRASATISERPKGTERLEKKMRAGSLREDVIELAKDYKHSAELLQAEWFYRYKPSGVAQRYGQLEMIVRTECEEAYDETYSEDDLFGRKMLSQVRRRLRERILAEPRSFFSCKYEHLLGIAALLTEECKVWWSKRFDVSDEVDA